MCLLYTTARLLGCSHLKITVYLSRNTCMPVYIVTGNLELLQQIRCLSMEDNSMKLWHTIQDYGIIIPFQRNYLLIILYNITHQSLEIKTQGIKA